MGRQRYASAPSIMLPHRDVDSPVPGAMPNMSAWVKTCEHKPPTPGTCILIVPGIKSAPEADLTAMMSSAMRKRPGCSNSTGRDGLDQALRYAAASSHQANKNLYPSEERLSECNNAFSVARNFSMSSLCSGSGNLTGYSRDVALRPR